MLFKSDRSKFEYLIAGLGNPGLEYENTRHNAGFIAIDKLASKLGTEFSKNKFSAKFGFAEISGKRVILVKPQTYMNNSGSAISEISRFYKIPPEKCIFMFDDISLDIGKIRIRRKGSAGGHNGIKDIIELLGTEDFPRIKIGVGERPSRDYDLKDWVLGKLPKESAEDFGKACDNAVKAVFEIIIKSIDSAMNKYSK